MNKLLIISIYDNGYEMSIWYDNKRYDENSENELYDNIFKLYRDQNYDWRNRKHYKNYLKSLDFDEIYECENGFIERVK